VTALSLLSENKFSVQEAMQALGLGREAVLRLFLDEPGVIVHGYREHQKRLGAVGEVRTRKYRSIAIPQSVLVRVAGRLINGEPSHAKLVKRGKRQ
jgi:hypothetical protein